MTEWSVTTLKEHIEALRAQDQKAISAALAAAQEKALAHNDLIKEMQRKEALYVTKASLWWALVGTVSVVSLIFVALNFFIKP